MVFRKLLGNNFFPGRTPRWSQRVIYWVFDLFQHAGHLEKFRTRAKNRKIQFPGPRGTFGKKSVRPKSFSLKLRNFLRFCVLADWTPRGGKSQNAAF